MTETANNQGIPKRVTLSSPWLSKYIYENHISLNMSRNRFVDTIFRAFFILLHLSLTFSFVYPLDGDLQFPSGDAERLVISVCNEHPLFEPFHELKFIISILRVLNNDYCLTLEWINLSHEVVEITHQLVFQPNFKSKEASLTANDDACDDACAKR